MTPAAHNFAKQMTWTWTDAEAVIKQAADRMKHSHDLHTHPLHQYNEGDKVYLETTNLKTDQPMKKLDDKHFGPFKVKCCISASAYQLELPKSWPTIHPIFNEAYLTPFKTPQFETQKNHCHHHPSLWKENQSMKWKRFSIPITIVNNFNTWLNRKATWEKCNNGFHGLIYKMPKNRLMNSIRNTLINLIQIITFALLHSPILVYMMNKPTHTVLGSMSQLPHHPMM